MPLALVGAKTLTVCLGNITTCVVGSLSCGCPVVGGWVEYGRQPFSVCQIKLRFSRLLGRKFLLLFKTLYIHICSLTATQGLEQLRAWFQVRSWPFAIHGIYGKFLDLSDPQYPFWKEGVATTPFVLQPKKHSKCSLSVSWNCKHHH
jgi:hypothetical protein